MSITLQISPVRAALLEGHDNLLEVVIQLRGPEPPEEQKARAPMSLALVLDRSGSMSGRPLEEAKRCAEMILERLREDDRASLVVYDNRVDRLFSDQSPSPLEPLLERLRRVDSGGTTDLHGGWASGADALAAGASNALRRVILLSDGVANAGLTASEEIIARCRERSGAGVTTSTYGLGTGFNEELMTGMAAAGGGNSYYGERAEDLLEPFEQEFDLLSALYAHQLQLELSPAEGVEVELLSPLQREGNAYLLRDLPYSAELWSAFRLRVSAAAVERGTPLLRVRLRAHSLDGEHLKLEGALAPLPVLPAAAFAAVAPSVSLERYLQSLQAAALKLEIRVLIQHGDWDAVDLKIEALAQLALDPIELEGVREMRDMAQSRQSQQLSKEMLFSAINQSSTYVVGIEQFAQQAHDSAEAQAAGERSKVSYLRKRVLQGRSTKR